MNSDIEFFSVLVKNGQKWALTEYKFSINCDLFQIFLRKKVITDWVTDINIATFNIGKYRFVDLTPRIFRTYFN